MNEIDRIRKRTIGGAVFWFLDGSAIVDFTGSNESGGPLFEAWIEAIKAQEKALRELNHDQFQEIGRLEKEIRSLHRKVRK